MARNFLLTFISWQTWFFAHSRKRIKDPENEPQVDFWVKREQVEPVYGTLPSKATLIKHKNKGICLHHILHPHFMMLFLLLLQFVPSPMSIVLMSWKM